MAATIHVLVVDDSPTARQMIVHILEAEPDLRVIGTAATGAEAVAFATQRKPDVITMDIHMPGVDGFEATRRIMESNPIPIVIISASYAVGDVDKAFRALEEGALAIFARPVGPADPRFEAQAREIRQSVRLMSEVKTVRRARRYAPAPATAPPAASPVSAGAGAPFDLVVLGASTGGPPVLQKILARLPADFTPTLLIVQHIAAGFIGGMVEWLNTTSRIPVHLARHGAQTLAGQAYVAPDDLHMGVDAARRIVLTRAPPEYGVRPSVAHLLRSAMESFGGRIIGVILTGMGKDGARELLDLRQRGGATIVQDRETCVVFGMPGEAVRLGAAMEILPPEQIPAALARLAGGGAGRSGA